jgi:hypothetical protein
MVRAVFELEDAAAAAMASELFGFWSTREPAPAPVSFVAGAGQPVEEPVIWRSRLPADLALAGRELAAAEIWQQQREQALQQALPRMQTLLSTDAGRSFPTQDLDDAERNLLAAVTEVHKPPESVSFGIGADLAMGWAAADRQIRDFMQQNMRRLLHAAWVETSVGERLRGRSIVGWGGDTRTVWQESIVAAELQLHRRSIDLALGTRLALIRSFGLAGRGAAIVATAVSSPIGPVMALPAAWRFINDLARPRRPDSTAQSV